MLMLSLPGPSLSFYLRLVPLVRTAAYLLGVAIYFQHYLHLPLLWEL